MESINIIKMYTRSQSAWKKARQVSTNPRVKALYSGQTLCGFVALGDELGDVSQLIYGAGSYYTTVADVQSQYDIRNA